MKEDWIMFWGWKFVRIAGGQTVFSWEFVVVVVLVAIAYLILFHIRAEARTKAEKPGRRFFRLRFKDVLFFLGLTISGMVIISALGLSITLHAEAFAEAMEKKCLAVEETEDSFVFKLPEGCGDRDVLWNQVTLDKEEGRAAYEFLKRQEIR